jgi:predicted dehydrogenase
MSDLRVGIIGMGGAGRAHARRFARHPRVREVVAYDPKPVRYRSFESTDDLDAVLADVDAVSICAPDDAHFDLITRSFAAGCHVLVEKPMTANAAEAAALGERIAAHADLVFAVHHQMRFVDAFRRARTMIREGVLGDVFYIEANYWHDNRERNVMYDDWRVREPGQSVIFGGACHPLDLMMDLADRPVVGHHAIANKIGYPEYPGACTAVTVLLDFEGGLVGKSHTNNCVVHPQLNDLVVLGDRASFIDGVLYRDGRHRATLKLHERFDSQSRRRHARGKLVWSPVAHALTACATRLPLFRRAPFSCYNHERASRALVDDFVTAVLDGTPVGVGYEDGRRVVELCEAIERQTLDASRRRAA